MLPSDDPRLYIKAGQGNDHDRRRREAQLLRDASHPGVVEIVALDERAEELHLQLAYVDGASLAERESLAIPTLIEIMISVGRTLGDLHRRGIAHGNLRSDHVLLDHRGRTVLCGFGHAGYSEDASAPQPADDVGALGRMIIGEITRIENNAPDEIDGSSVSDLRALAEEAVAEPARPGHLRELLAHLTRLRATEPRSGDGRGRWSPLPRGRWVVIALLVLVGVVAAVTWMPGTAPARPGRDTSTGAEPQPITTTGQSPSGESPDTTAAPLDQPSAPPQPTLLRPAASPTPTTVCTTASSAQLDRVRLDFDGDGCPEFAVLDDGDIVVRGQRWGLGEPSDYIVLGDWDCDGIDTPGLVRHDTGAVYFFDQWPRDPASVAAPAVAVLPGVTGAHRESSPNGCDILIVTTESGPVDVGPRGRLS